MLRKIGLAVALAFVPACGSEADQASDAASTDDAAMASVSGTEDGEGNIAIADVASQTEVGESASVANSKCPSDPQVFCRGPILVRVSNANIDRDEYRFGAATPGYVGRATFVIENNSDGPVRFNVLGRDTISMVLENGLELSQANRNETRGIEPCRSDMKRCLERENDNFVDLPVGESPATVEMVFDARTSVSADRSISRVEEAAINLPLVVETADGDPFKVDTSFRNVAVFNNLAN